MVCAMQELATAAVAAASEQQSAQHLQVPMLQQQQQQHHQLQQQQQQRYNPPSIQLQPQQHQTTTIVLLTSAAPTAGGNLQQQHALQAAAASQRLPAAKSQQLKQQHSALVKLLESAPLTKKSSNASAATATASPIVKPQMQQEQRHIVYVQQSQQQQQLPQLATAVNASNNSSSNMHTNVTQRKRLKSMLTTTKSGHDSQAAQLLLAPTAAAATAIVVDDCNIAVNIIKTTTTNSINNEQLVRNNSASDLKLHQQHQQEMRPQHVAEESSMKLKFLNSAKNDSESGIDDDADSDHDIPAKKTLDTTQTAAGIIASSSATAANMNAIEMTNANDNYEHYQCPWKKIRYAREWKQREQLQQQQQQSELHTLHHKQQEEQQSNEHQISNGNATASNSNSAKGGALTSTSTTITLSEQTHKEITMLLQQQQQQHLQQHRRDSSDSNSSLLSNSSTQSLTGGCCTCTPQQLAAQQQMDDDDDIDIADIKRQRRLNQNGAIICHCSDCQSQDMDSGCDDELCENHHHQQQQQQYQTSQQQYQQQPASLLEQTTLNYLCQKFDENLETTASGANNSNSNNNSNTVATNEIKSETDGEMMLADETAATATAAATPTANDVRGFFRRSIQQKIQYRPCTKNQQCSILRINRNRCQYCRLKKCIAVGMSRDAVRFGRVPKREKARILAAMQQSTQNRGQQRALATELDDQPRLLAAVLRAHLETCEFTKDKVTAMRQRARDCPSYSMPTLLACPLNPAPELQSEQEFSQRFAHVIRGVIDFAGMIPGFQLLTQDDKFTLLKAGLFDALFVRLICMFDSSINSIICLNGQVMRRDAIQNGANARFLVDSTFNFAERMNSMNLTDAEIGLFCAIVLITPDRPGLRNIELIEKMYSRLKGCLQSIINQNRPDQPDFMGKLLETMPDLRTLSTLHTEKLVVFRTEHKELLRQQMWTMDDEQPPNSKSPGSSWDDARMDVEAKSPLGSVSSTESGDLEYTTSTTAPSSHHNQHHVHQPSALASSAPLLAATLSGTCPLRNRANSGSSGDSGADLDIVGSHSHLTQNGLTITPIVRSHSHQQLHHHLTTGTQHRYRKLDSPTDSGIESGNEKNECGSKTVSSGGSSSCSSPRSSVDDALDCTDAAAASTSQVTVSVSPVRSPQPHNAAAPTSTSAATSTANSPSTLKRQIVEDMPVLKRVLQAPPLYDTNSLMDEAYKPHKKFRALRHREYEIAEADASSTSHGSNNAATTTGMPACSPVQSSQSASTSPAPAPTAHSSAALVMPQASVSPAAASSPHPPPALNSHQHAHTHTHHQSQLHMHLTRPTPTPTNTNTNNNQQPHQQQQQQQTTSSSLSSTHSVLAKSLMAEPRMTPEQMKRSDIIQNYIMRDPTPTSASSSGGNGLLVCTPNGARSRSPAQQQHLAAAMHHAAQHYATNGSPALSSSSASSNSNCASPSTTTVTLASPPPAAAAAGRWPGHSVITTTSINQRQQSVSPSSNGSSSSSNSSNSSSSGCQYFQSPHSTSASVSPPRPSPSAMHTPPRLLELQVDIADSQQPLNLSKKSPTPPPSKLQALVAAATAAQRYPTVSADVTVTATTTSAPVVASATPASSTQPMQVHKVMLEA